MAKPAWIEIINGASGSGSTTRTLKAKAHTGRLSRSGSIKGTVSSGESDTVSLSQIGANEFISINSQSYSVTALGGVVTITGTSNSPSLKITNLSNASIISSRSLKINGTTYTWDGDSSHLITNDPGAANTYSFEISLSIIENQTESSRSTSFYLSDSGSTVVKTSTISITQAAGVKTYGTEDFTLNYNTWDIPASGGTASCIYSFTIPWGWNGKTSGGGTLTQNDEHAIEFNYRDDGPDYPFDWSLDSNTGDITVASLGTNETTSSSGNIYIQATVTIQGKTIYAEDYVEQQANEVSYRLGDVELSVDDIPASGGTASVNFISGVGYTNYSSGESSTTSLFSSSDVSIDHNDISADNLGTIVKGRTKVGTLNVTVTWNGVTEFPSLDVYQEANTGTNIEYGTPSVSITVDDIPASGGTISSGTVTYSQTQEQYFTSGASETLSEITSGGTVSYGSAVSASSLGTTKKSRSVVGTLTVDITLNGKSGSASADVYQEANNWSLMCYEDVTYTDVGADGSAATPQYTGSPCYFLYTSGDRANVYYSENIVITYGVDYSTGVANNASINESDGSVTADSLGKTVTSRKNIIDVIISYSYTDSSGYTDSVTSKPIYVYQEANEIESTTTEGGDVSYSNIIMGRIVNDTIPASGGSGTASASKGSVTKRKEPIYNVNTYTSGSVDKVLSSYGSSGAVEVEPSVSSITTTASSKGTTISEKTTIKSQDVTWEIGGLSVSDTMYIYQEANEKTSVLQTDIRDITSSSTGDALEMFDYVNPKLMYIYTSGSSEEKEGTSIYFTYEPDYSYDYIVWPYANAGYFGFNENESASARSGNLTILVSVYDSDISNETAIDTQTVIIPFTQAAKKADPTFIIDHDEFYADGKLTFDNSTTIAVLTVTDNDNVGWFISSSDLWVTLTATQGTGTQGVSITVKSNTTKYDRSSLISCYRNTDDKLLKTITITQLAISHT